MDGKMIMEIIVSVFLVIGAVFSLAGSIGFIRFPDVYCCMHALSKPVTIGVASLMIGYLTFIECSGVGFSTQGVLAVVFIMITVPIGSHMIAKATYRNGVPLWNGSVVDQLAEEEGRPHPPAQTSAENPPAVEDDPMDRADFQTPEA